MPATPHRTAEKRLAAPAPMIPPEITCVVESGSPTLDAARITAGAAPWAAKPWRVHLDPRTQGLDDPPAAGERPERDRRGRGRPRPVRNVEVVGGDVTVGDQRERRSLPSSSGHRSFRATAPAVPARGELAEAESSADRTRAQLATFQAIAPTSPANTTVGVTALVSTTPGRSWSRPRRDERPREVQQHASASACLGPIARVEIEVATTLAVS